MTIFFWALHPISGSPSPTSSPTASPSATPSPPTTPSGTPSPSVSSSQSPSPSPVTPSQTPSPSLVSESQSPSPESASPSPSGSQSPARFESIPAILNVSNLVLTSQKLLPIDIAKCRDGLLRFSFPKFCGESASPNEQRKDGNKWQPSTQNIPKITRGSFFLSFFLQIQSAAFHLDYISCMI